MYLQVTNTTGIQLTMKLRLESRTYDPPMFDKTVRVKPLTLVLFIY